MPARVAKEDRVMGTTYSVRWSRQAKQTLEITDPWGEVHLVSATQEGIPKAWRREAGQRLSDEKMRQRTRTGQAAQAEGEGEQK